MFWRKGNCTLVAGALAAMLLGSAPVAAKAERPTSTPHAAAASWTSLWSSLVAWWATGGDPGAEGTVPTNGSQLGAGPLVDPNGGSKLDEGPLVDPNGHH